MLKEEERAFKPRVITLQDRITDANFKNFTKRGK
jgi:hypothetical protein